MKEILGKRNIKDAGCEGACIANEVLEDWSPDEIAQCIAECPEVTNTDDTDGTNTNTNTSGGLEYWVNTGLDWLGQGADIYSQVSGGDTGTGVDVTDLEEADSQNDYSKYYLYGGIGFGVIILLLIVSKVIANKQK